MKQTDIDRFFSMIIKTNTCWLWRGSIKRARYGTFRISGKQIYAHRLSFIYHNGPIPIGLSVCHRCDFPPCVNPDHLFIGTHKDNTADCLNKGRHYSTKIKTPIKCTSGHVFSNGNFYLNAKNRRICKICSSERNKQDYLRRKKS